VKQLHYVPTWPDGMDVVWFRPDRAWRDGHRFSREQPYDNRWLKCPFCHKQIRQGQHSTAFFDDRDLMDDAHSLCLLDHKFKVIS
jgi:hypothetical protein